MLLHHQVHQSSVHLASAEEAEQHHLAVVAEVEEERSVPHCRRQALAVVEVELLALQNLGSVAEEVQSLEQNQKLQA